MKNPVLKKLIDNINQTTDSDDGYDYGYAVIESHEFMNCFVIMVNVDKSFKESPISYEIECRIYDTDGSLISSEVVESCEI